MAYTPELSQKHSASLRRIAWALEIPMTKAIEVIFDYLGTVINSEKICAFCKDKTRCAECSFN